MDYWEKRTKIKKKLLSALDEVNLTNCLQGSWRSGDFHLNDERGFSYSDIDILCIGISDVKRRVLIQSIAKKISSLFEPSIRISIHSGKSLYQINTSDAQILGIAEYIAQYHKSKQNCFKNIDYINAKFTLLLLRKFPEERYSEVATRIGTLESMAALDVKLGCKEYFPTEYAKSLIEGYGNQTTIEFLNECIIGNPNEDFTRAILNKLSQCKTVDLWLFQYLVKKINVHLPI